MKAHTGFILTHAKSADNILRTVQMMLKDGAGDEKRKPERVYVTGYSLGAATAVLTAVQLRLALGESVPVVAITIGTPMVRLLALRQNSSL